MDDVVCSTVMEMFREGDYPEAMRDFNKHMNTSIEKNEFATVYLFSKKNHLMKAGPVDKHTIQIASGINCSNVTDK